MIGEQFQPGGEATWPLVLAGSGLFILAYLIWRQVRGAPVFRPDPDRFATGDTSGFILLALALFCGYQACAYFVMSTEYYTWWGAGLAILVSFLLAAGWYLFAVRRVMRPQGSAPWRIGVGLLLLWAAMPAVYGCLELMNLVLPPMGEQPQVIYIRDRGEGWEMMALFAVVVAPLLEEIGFRGLLYPAMRRLAGPTVATAVTAALFGATHYQANVIFPLAVLGVFLALMVEATGSILPGIVAHMCFNGLTVALIVLA